MKAALRFVVLLTVAIALGACASRAVREPPAELVDFESTYRVREVWSADIGSGAEKDYVRLVPKVAAGVVYTADVKGNVSAFAADTGGRKWTTDLETSVGGAVGVGDTLVLIGTRQGQVVALERDTGKRLWTAPVSSEILAPPAIGDDVVVAQTIDGRLFGFAAADGKRMWVYERTEPALSLRGTGSPIIVGDAVVAGFASGKIVAVRLRDGGLLSEMTVSQPRGRNEIERLVDVDAQPVILPDALYVANFQGKLVSLNPRNGTAGWSRDVSTYTGIATDGENIYVSDDKGHVMAFDRRSGANVWRQEGLRGRRLNAPVVHNNLVAVADGEGYVHWLARDDGRFLARYRVGSDPIRAPGVVDGETLYVAGTTGSFAALRLVQK